ncbi:MAG: hypothetical protein ABSF79_07900 [Smithellaceae bacterium]|jgi:hypothetical protein
MKDKNYFSVLFFVSIGILVGICFSNYFKTNNTLAGNVPYSNLNLNCEYLNQASNDLGVGYLYRCKVPNGWLLIHDNKKNGLSNTYIPDPSNTWK